MALGIGLVVAVVVISIVAALFLMRPGGGRYTRMAEKELRRDNFVPAEPEERERPAPRPFRVAGGGGDSSLTTLIVAAVRVVIGLAAVGVLAYIYTSTVNSASAATGDTGITAAYTTGIFKAVITIGIAAALYIFTKFSK